MANAITITKAIDGSRLFETKIHIVGDGSGEETNTVAVDCSALLNSPSDFKIRAIQWSLDSFSVVLNWDATTDTHAYTLPAGSDGIRFSDTGAHLVNNSGAGKTGDLLFTTIGLGSGQTGVITIEGQRN